jgi:hypothetical protein
LFFFHHCSSHSSYSSRQSSSIAFNREIDKYESRTLHSPHTDCRCRLHAVFNRPVDQSRIVIDVPWPHAQHVSGHEAIPACSAQREELLLRKLYEDSQRWLQQARRILRSKDDSTLNRLEELLRHAELRLPLIRCKRTGAHSGARQDRDRMDR